MEEGFSVFCLVIFRVDVGDCGILDDEVFGLIVPLDVYFCVKNIPKKGCHLIYLYIILIMI